MKLMENWRIVVLAVCVLLSIYLVATKGLSLGIDFTGGTEIKMQLDAGGEAVVDSVVDILKNRLNGMGLKSTQVLKEADGRHITLKISTTDPGDLENLKSVLNQTAVFEQLVEGELCAKGDEISLDITQQGGAFISGTRWQIFVRNSGDSPARCGKVMEGMSGRMTDIFLDRPDKSFILADAKACTEMSNLAFSSHAQDSGYTVMSFLEDRALIPVVCFDVEISDVAVNETLLEDLGLEVETEETNSSDLSSAAAQIASLSGEGKTSAIIMFNETLLPETLRSTLLELNITVKAHPRNRGDPYYIDGDEESWIPKVTGLKSTLSIGEGLTNGNPVYSSVFEGGSSTAADAKKTAETFKIWLTSGNLPIKLTIVLERPNLPELGQQFLKYIGLIAIIALGLVAALISIRYRKMKLSVFILLTSVSEIIIVIGFASVTSWELDMSAMAGIIAAIGTGVNHQVVITDETLRGERKKEKQEQKVWDIKEALGRAFFIIITSVLTIILVMLPLMSIIDLRGFAFTTIIGACIGLLITRPAYARIIELMMK